MSIREDFLKNRSLGDVFTVDHHTHCGGVGVFRSESDYAVVQQELIRLDIDVGIVSNVCTYDIPNAGNDMVQQIAEASNGRIFGQIFLRAGDEAGYEEEIDRRVKSGVFTGIKLHPVIENRDIDDPFYCKVCGIAGELGYPVLFHTWGLRDMGIIADVAKKCPKTVIFIGHCGGELDASLRAGELAAQYDNLYLDFTCTRGYANLLEYYVKTASAEKILFGSDANWNSVTSSLGRVLFADLTDAEMRLILGGNARRLYPKLQGKA